MTVTIGIPTYECGKSLVTTLDSIRANSVADNQILIAVDGDQNIDRLESLDLGEVQVKVFKLRQGQSTRINDLFAWADTDILILTNDDVKWDANALASIINTFEQTGADLVTTQMVPLLAKGLEEKIINFGAAVSNQVVVSYHQGHSYLGCNGRLIALSRKLYSTLKIPTDIWNNDAYLYFAAVLNGYRHEHCVSAICYYRSPLHLSEHFKQSVKFQVSKDDLQVHFKDDLTRYYTVPLWVLLKAFCIVLLANPLTGIAYLAVHGWSKWLALVSPLKKTKLTYWETDASTKLI